MLKVHITTPHLVIDILICEQIICDIMVLGDNLCMTLCIHVSNLNTQLLADIDPCSLNIDVCAQICISTIGSYYCTCTTGYSLASDGRSYDGI